MNLLNDFFADWAGGKVRGFALTLLAIGVACAAGAVLAVTVCTGPPADPCSAHGWSVLAWVLGPIAVILFVVGELIFLLGRTLEREVKAVYIPERQVHVDLRRVPPALQPIFAPPPPRSALEAELRGAADALSRDAQELLGIRIVTHTGPQAPPPVYGTFSPCPHCRRPVVYGSPVCPACLQRIVW